MDKVKNITRNGYHPTGKDGGKESWRGDHKSINQVAGWVGKGKPTGSASTANDHVSRPLTTLQDPATFGPPPKNINFHGGVASPSNVTADHRGLGSPVPTDQPRGSRNYGHEKDSTARKAEPPPVPYRADRTGLNSSTLPKPPIRRNADASSSTDNVRASTAAANTLPPKPRLPPRLPPRQNSQPIQPVAEDAPPTYTAATQEQQQWQAESPARQAQGHPINRGAVSRLGAAGITVPGFGIGRTTSPSQSQASENPWRDESSPTNTPSSTTDTSVSSLQSRFGKMTTALPPPTSSTGAAPSASPGGGTTFAQKQAALKTASSFRNDPSSISIADARATASTANNFRERHGEEVKQGWKVGNGLNKKYGITDRVGGLAAPTTSGAGSAGTTANDIAGENPWSSSPSSGGGTGTSAASSGRSGFGQSMASAASGINRKPPPPIPLSSKPR